MLPIPMATETPTPIIAVDNLDVGFAMRRGMLQVLHGVSFELYRGQPGPRAGGDFHA